jgi:aminoglycoside 3-N-acetyltransferase
LVGRHDLDPFVIKTRLKRLLPTPALAYLRNLRTKFVNAKKKRLPELTEDAFKEILVDELELNAGDVVFIHSSINNLNLRFPFFRIFHILQEILGPHGTILFPTYPSLTSYIYLMSGEIFDVRKTRSYTGILTEFARKQRNSVRSLHPTKSVCAIGSRAEFLTKSHQNSPYPYDSCSPYYKLVEEKSAKIVGLGVTTNYLSFVHCVDDTLKEKFPIQPYHPRLFQAKCINYSGEVEVVSTFAHNLRMMNHNIPLYMRRYIPNNICEDMTLYGMKFFRARAKDLFDLMLDLAKKDVTIYSQKRLGRTKLL